MEDSIYVKYLITNEQDALWGLTINTVGFQKIQPNTDYPPRNHPAKYFFNIQKGRILEEYVLLYITEGKGTFTTADKKEVKLKAGDILLLFPGEWHSYCPDKSTGWQEYWIGFNGGYIDNLIDNKFFNKQKLIFNLRLSEEIIQLYLRGIQVAKEQKAGYQQVLAGIVNYLLGIVYSQDKSSVFEEMETTIQMDKAKMIMFENSHTDLRPEDIAKRVFMSYSWFRHTFKQYTGLSPHQYIQKIRIQKSKELLANTQLNNLEIALAVGYDSSDYFCTTFKKKTGISPIKYRKFIQGKKQG